MSRISLNGSSFVGKQAAYRADWADSVDAVNAYYQPLMTFPQRFSALLSDVEALGFDTLDIWTAGQLNWAWATPEHIEIAADLLAEHGLHVSSLGGEFGATRDELESACRMAVGVGTSLLSGTVPLLFTDRAAVVSILRDHGVQLAIENHPEEDSAEMLAKIGDGAGGVIGTAIDTGWYATRGYDPVRAIHELQNVLLHIHLKDVLAGAEHVNCGYGKGIVPIEGCLQALEDVGYDGDISVENHATDHDPTAELRDGLQLVRRMLDA